MVNVWEYSTKVYLCAIAARRCRYKEMLLTHSLRVSDGVNPGAVRHGWEVAERRQEPPGGIVGRIVRQYEPLHIETMGSIMDDYRERKMCVKADEVASKPVSTVTLMPCFQSGIQLQMVICQKV